MNTKNVKDAAENLEVVGEIERANNIDTAKKLYESFIVKRLANSELIEDAKLKAVTMLIEKVNDDTSPTMLLKIIDRLGTLNAVDFTLMAGNTDKNKNPMTNIYNITEAGGSDDNGVIDGEINPKVFKELDKLVLAAESIIDAAEESN